MKDRVQDVQKYYESNTNRFQRYGQSGLSIHRAVWGPGVTTRDAAAHFVDDLILTELQSFAPIPRVLDMGCGVGASLLYFAQRLAIVGEGVTISPVQASQGSKLFESAQMNNLRCRSSDFLALPSDIYDVDLAFSIEAFVHSPDATSYFSEAARVVRPGGKLIICDDFLSRRASLDPSTKERKWLQEFRRGWKIGTLVTVDSACETARPVGFTLIRVLDLTPFLRLRRPRDILISFLVSTGKYLSYHGGEYWSALVGGNALQLATSSGALSYQYLVFERNIEQIEKISG
jgi:cyclopropane fatty-acyl-phospholipid synthase-like methyltransferase